MAVAGGPRRGDDRRVSTLWTRLCRELGIEYPIRSVGMGMVAGPGLAAAVSNSGGSGVFGTQDLSAMTIQVQVGRAARMEHLENQLAAADVALDQAVLDGIDEIVPPGTTINPVDNSFQNPALQPAARRRQGAS
jgi:NAD(P)H-dependent flavin oxidoreductase YrpB (nitropropane dioxygenase family)